MIKKVIKWFKSLFSNENAKTLAEEVHQTVIATASSALNEFINDPANQAAAKEAVQAVAKSGVTGNQALNDAVNFLKGRGLDQGREAANTLLRTLVQIVFADIKLAAVR